MARNAPNAHYATVVDGASLFDAADAIGERFGRAKITIDYTRLHKRLQELRQLSGWHPSTINSIVLSMDPSSEGQQRFQSMLRHSGFEPDVVYFRDAYVSLPPGRNPSDAAAKSAVSLAPRIAYIAGLMARFPTSEFLVVSHSYELCGPLVDLAERMQRGRVGLAYFGSLLDYRWRLAGLMEKKLPIDYFDLDEFGQELIGVDLIGRVSSEHQAYSGLKQF